MLRLRGLLRAHRPISGGRAVFLRWQHFRHHSSAVPESVSREKVGPEWVRNVAIIAHVDHGKTTLCDKLLRDTTGSDPVTQRLMDSMSLEKERGITIMSKATQVEFDEHRLSLVDTPGHSDFGGEVERVLSIVDGVVLLVDATEGPMPQTKFVLGKAIEIGLRPIVVINKVDRPASRVEQVENDIFDLFCGLDASDELLDYPVLYCSAKEGWAVTDLKAPRESMAPLLDAIVKSVPPPCGADQLSKPFSFEVNSIETDSFLGRVCMGRVRTGTVRVGDVIKAMNRQGELLGDGVGPPSKVTKIYCKKGGLIKLDLEEACAGDIVWIAGVTAGVSDTIAAPEVNEPLPTRALDPPTLSMVFSANTSPLGGKEGIVSGRNMLARLHREVENNVSLRLKSCPEPDSIEVHGRGEMQLGILIEQLRREKFELCVAPPKVLTRRCEQTGREMEPMEEVVIDVDSDYSGVVMDKITARKGVLKDMKEHREKQRLIFSAPTRGLLGVMNEIRTETRGSAIINRLFEKFSYSDDVGSIQSLMRGKLVSMDGGKSTAYALAMLEDRGVLFIGPGEEVYPGMIVGEHSRPTDLDVNPTRAKKTTNVRSVNADEAIRLQPYVKRSLEELLAYMSIDELLEVTPTKLRLRKQELDANVRAKKAKARKQQQQP